MPGFLGIQEIVLLLVLGLIVFGAKRLPEIGRSLGRGMRASSNTESAASHKHETVSFRVRAPLGGVPSRAASRVDAWTSNGSLRD